MKTVAHQKAAESRARQGSTKTAAPRLSAPAYDFTAAPATVFRKSACPCGGGCPDCQSPSGSLKVSQPTDASEIEADQLADRVMRLPSGESAAVGGQSQEPGKLHAKCDGCEEESEAATMFRKQDSVAAVEPPPDDGSPSVNSVTRSGGAALDPASRSFFEPRFGMDLGHVRVHADALAGRSARSINARAYTFGNNIVFGSGEYRPHDSGGRHLLAHELSHVALHGEGPRAPVPHLHRKPTPQSATQVPAVPSSIESAIRQPGEPLAPTLRTRAENFFGQDLGHVRVHADAQAASAASRHRAHAISAGPHILLSRHRSDLSRSDAQRTLAHEIAHTLQSRQGTSSQQFDAEGSAAEREAHAASSAFMDGAAPFTAWQSSATRGGLSKERDPRLDNLVGVIERMPLVLSDRGIAEELQRAAPDLDIADRDNFEPLILLLDEHFGGGGIGERVFSEWYLIRSGPAPARRSMARTRRDAPAPAPPPELEAPTSMSGTELEAEIAELRASMDMPPLVVDAPQTSPFEPRNADDRRRYERLVALETEYYDRRGLLETMREGIATLEEQQRSESRIGVTDVVDMSLGLTTGTLPMDLAGAALGHPLDDATTGFLAGFLGGAVLELPRDDFIRLDAETRAHPIDFNGGVLVGLPVGAAEGLRDMVVGLYDLLELLSQFTPEALMERGMREAWRMIADREALLAERTAQYEQAREVCEAIAGLIQNMFNDPAFMLAHGRELGEIAGRASGRWFHDDFMERSTFDKGYAIGKVEGRIVFEIVALFLGPEEWVARGAAAVGEVARLSGPLRRAILAFIERFPALRRLLVAGREATTVAREAALAERTVAEGGEVLADASRASERLGEASRGSGVADDGTRALESSIDDGTRAAEGTLDEAGDATRAADEPTAPREREPEVLDTHGLDPGDLREVGEVNPETLDFFREHPDRLHAWAEGAEARRVCKLCQSPCFPENVSSDQARRLEQLLEGARRRGRTPLSDHALHDALAPLDGPEVERFIDELSTFLGDPPSRGIGDAAFGDELMGVLDNPVASGMDEAVPIIERVPGRASEAQFSGDLGEGLEIARSGATAMPPTYASRFSRATREELRRIFSTYGRDALQEFVRRLELGPSGLRQVEIPTGGGTGSGLRRVDRLFLDGETIVMREVKRYPSAVLDETPRIADELAKDVAAIQQYDGARVEWDITGNITDAFLEELRLLEATSEGRFVLVPKRVAPGATAGTSVLTDL